VLDENDRIFNGFYQSYSYQNWK